MVCKKCYADQDVLDAKQVLYDEYSHELGDPQNRQESNNRSKAEKSVEDIYVAFQKFDEMKVEPCFAAVDIKRLPNFTPEEMDLTSVLERLVRLENKMNSVEGNVSLCRAEHTDTRQKVDDVLNEVLKHGILLQKQERQTKYADAVQLNRDNNNLTVRASLPVACHVQHAPEAVRPPRSTNRATGTTNAMTTQKVAYPVQQAPPKPKSCDGNNGQKWTVVENKKRNMVFGTGCGSDRVHGAPPPSRDLVIERVSKVTKETDLKDHIKSKGVCVRSLSLMSHIDAKHQTFKLEIYKDDLTKVYNPDFSPCCINIRRYFPPKGSDKRTGSTLSNGETGVNSNQNET